MQQSKLNSMAKPGRKHTQAPRNLPAQVGRVLGGALLMWLGLSLATVGLPDSVASFMDPDIRAESPSGMPPEAVKAGVPDFFDVDRRYYTHQRWTDDHTLVVSLWHWGLDNRYLDGVLRAPEEQGLLLIEPIWGSGWHRAPTTVDTPCGGCNRLELIEVTYRGMPKKPYVIAIRERQSAGNFKP